LAEGLADDAAGLEAGLLAAGDEADFDGDGPGLVVLQATSPTAIRVTMKIVDTRVADRFCPFIFSSTNSGISIRRSPGYGTPDPPALSFVERLHLCPEKYQGKDAQKAMIADVHCRLTICLISKRFQGQMERWTISPALVKIGSEETPRHCGGRGTVALMARLEKRSVWQSLPGCREEAKRSISYVEYAINPCK